ncbi:MAG TPA: GNAT family N-acetyltransferase [Candidatus Limnocylindrales bacterium]|nr:GNAT family N-acetyltransferase [Candidatus Limnocylindrales bacterium]
MTSGITIDRGTQRDSRACHEVLYASLNDFERRFGTPLDGTEPEWWAAIAPYFGLLEAEFAEWWVAKDEAGTIVGYSRSIEHGGMFELTELFVRPDHQGKGLGRELLDRSFPAGRGEFRSIIATRDVRALANYYASGVAVRFPILGLDGAPAAAEQDPGLSVHRVAGEDDPAADAIRDLERPLLGFERSDAGRRTLLASREAYFYRRGDTAVGFSFVSPGGCGPIGALDPADLPGIMLHVEDRASALGVELLSLQVPAANEVATRHLLGRGFRFEAFISFLMSDRSFGRYDRVVCFSPPLFL